MNPLKIAGFSLTLTGVLLLQGCGGSSGTNSASSSASIISTSSVTSSASNVTSSSSSTAPSVSVAETKLGADLLSPDSGIAAANTLVAEYISPENSQASTALVDGDLPPL